MPTTGTPASMPTATPRMQCASAHAVPPTSSAASHSGVLVAKVADTVCPTERRAPLLESCMQSSVIVPALLRRRWARLLLHIEHLCGSICKCIISLVLLNDLVEA